MYPTQGNMDRIRLNNMAYRSIVYGLMVKHVEWAIYVILCHKLHPGYLHHLDEINNDKPKCKRKRKEIKVN